MKGKPAHQDSYAPRLIVLTRHHFFYFRKRKLLRSRLKCLAQGHLFDLVHLGVHHWHKEKSPRSSPTRASPHTAALRRSLILAEGLPPSLIRFKGFKVLVKNDDQALAAMHAYRTAPNSKHAAAEAARRGASASASSTAGDSSSFGGDPTVDFYAHPPASSAELLHRIFSAAMMLCSALPPGAHPTVELPAEPFQQRDSTVLDSMISNIQSWTPPGGNTSPTQQQQQQQQQARSPGQQQQHSPTGAVGPRGDEGADEALRKSVEHFQSRARRVGPAEVFLALGHP